MKKSKTDLKNWGTIMSQNNQKMIKEYTINELFKDKSKYLIPIYQRNYAWGKSEVEQLVIDINDYANEKTNQNYYIGTLVVFKRDDEYFETIDGQQRLTTLSILLSVLKNKFNKEINFNHLLSYESREVSTKTLEFIYNDDIEDRENINPFMIDAYKNLVNIIEKNVKDIEKFVDYLLNKVVILRVEVPKDTDLNHYFEVMNNRGEQLEKHEILKADMLSKLDNDNDREVFNTIWEACSDMNRYVQYGFLTNIRDKFFGDNWNSFELKNFDELEESFNFDNHTDINLEEKKYSIDDILDNKYDLKQDKDNSNKNEDKPDRFLSPINFQNFLLHVYKITKDNKAPLDDKRLLEIIKPINKESVKEFGYNLLKMRFLFDNYVIKRDYGGEKEEWSLKLAYKYTYQKKNQKSIQYRNSFNSEDKNKQILMILSMFHVSNPSQNYKYWLSGVLKFLFENYNATIDENNYLNYLENLAEKFFKRLLSKNKDKLEYDELIFLPCSFSYVIDITMLHKGTSVEHFIFNYLDYLIWKQDKNKYSYFSFSFSNSVEHFYPQKPIDGHSKLDKEDGLDNFGNLCLISLSKNAKLNNHPPISKKAYYPNEQYDSLKQHIMMERADEWTKNPKEEILNHQEEMIKILEFIQQA